TQLTSNECYCDGLPVWFGESVAAAGDVNGDGYDDVMVRAPGEGFYTNSGAVLIFLGSASGIADGNANTAATRFDAPAPGSPYLGTIGTSFGGRSEEHTSELQSR